MGGVYPSGPTPFHLPWFAQGNGNDYKPAYPVTKISLSSCAAFLLYILKFSGVKEAQKTLDMIENCKTNRPSPTRIYFPLATPNVNRSRRLGSFVIVYVNNNRTKNKGI